MVQQKKDRLITEMFTITADEIKARDCLLEAIEGQRRENNKLKYSDYGKSEPKKLSIIGDQLYLDGERLPRVTSFSISFEEEYSEDVGALVGLPLLRVNGVLNDTDGSPMIRFDDFVEYNIEERVKIVGGEFDY